MYASLLIFATVTRFELKTALRQQRPPPGGNARASVKTQSVEKSNTLTGIGGGPSFRVGNNNYSLDLIIQQQQQPQQQQHQLQRQQQ